MRRWADEAHARRAVADAGDRLIDLVARQFAAFAGLRALRHLDLQLVGVRQVVDRHAEAARGDLLDLRAPLVEKTLGILTPLAGFRAPADAVHRDREVLVRLARERAERH